MVYTDFDKVENILVEDIRQTHGYKTTVNIRIIIL